MIFDQSSLLTENDDPLITMNLFFCSVHEVEKIISFFSGTSRFQHSDYSNGPQSVFRRSSDLSRQRTIESMIVVEKVMTKFYGVQQIKKYVPTIVNVVREIKLRKDANNG